MDMAKECMRMGAKHCFTVHPHRRGTVQGYKEFTSIIRLSHMLSTHLLKGEKIEFTRFVTKTKVKQNCLCND